MKYTLLLLLLLLLYKVDNFTKLDQDKNRLRICTSDEMKANGSRAMQKQQNFGENCTIFSRQRYT
jgi:hypothetical protein